MGYQPLSSPVSNDDGRYFLNPSPYSTHGRVVALVPPDTRVLDVGCARGYLAEKLVEKGCTVFGVELDRLDAESARQHCAEVLQADVEALTELPWEKGSFDVILLMDLLEHLREPAPVLRLLREYVKPSGIVVITLPNVANWRIRFRLMAGKWDYEERGILERTHLRFFTLASARAMLNDCGFAVEGMDVSPGVEAWAPYRFTVGKFLSLFRANVAFDYRLSKLFPGMFAFQFILVARPG